jgi:hypothetical protein
MRYVGVSALESSDTRSGAITGLFVIGLPGWLGPQRCDGCTEAGLRRIPELLYERVSFEGLVDASALYADAAAVDQANFPKARGVSGDNVLFDDRRYVPRSERM